jgi:hypothetical protein
LCSIQQWYFSHDALLRKSSEGNRNCNLFPLQVVSPLVCEWGGGGAGGGGLLHKDKTSFAIYEMLKKHFLSHLLVRNLFFCVPFFEKRKILYFLKIFSQTHFAKIGKQEFERKPFVLLHSLDVYKTNPQTGNNKII